MASRRLQEWELDVHAYEGARTMEALDAAIIERRKRGERVEAKPCECPNAIPVPDEDPRMPTRCLLCGKKLG